MKKREWNLRLYAALAAKSFNKRPAWMKALSYFAGREKANPSSTNIRTPK